MKKLLYFLLIVTPNILLGQQKSNEPFKGATKLIIADTLSADNNFKLMGTKLNQLEYYIESKDTDFKSLISKPFAAKYIGPQGGSSNYIQTIFIVVADNKIVITSKMSRKPLLKLLGQYQSDPTTNNVVWNKHEGKFFFDNILKLVADLPSASVTYSE